MTGVPGQQNQGWEAIKMCWEILRSLLCKRRLFFFFFDYSQLGLVAAMDLTMTLSEMAKHKLLNGFLFFYFFWNASLGGDAWWEGNAFQFPWNKGNKAGIAARIVLYFQSIVCQCFNNTHFVFLKHLTTFLLEEVEVIGFVFFFFLKRLHNEVSRLV